MQFIRARINCQRERSGFLVVAVITKFDVIEINYTPAILRGIIAMGARMHMLSGATYSENGNFRIYVAVYVELTLENSKKSYFKDNSSKFEGFIANMFS